MPPNTTLAEVDHVPLESLPAVAERALKEGRHADAVAALTRLHQAMGEQTPRVLFGMLATALHALGRYDEAERAVHDGLGEQRAILAIPPVHSEAALRTRWRRPDSPVVSILCTTYNHERFIEHTLRGFLCQTTTYPFEILVHDDASTDRTAEIVRRWQAQYPTIIKPVLQTENQFSRGIRPFELLLARARGRYIATCEGDDFWIDAGKLQQQVELLERYPEFSCTAHNHWHFHEPTMQVKPWLAGRGDMVLSQRQLMGVKRLLWLPTLLFRHRFTAMPPEQRLTSSGDFVLTSLLGTYGTCLYRDGVIASVRRENAFSSWSPLDPDVKEQRRVKTWTALVEMHTRLGNPEAVIDLMQKIAASPLDETRKAALLAQLLERQPALQGAA